MEQQPMLSSIIPRLWLTTLRVVISPVQDQELGSRLAIKQPSDSQHSNFITYFDSYYFGCSNSVSLEKCIQNDFGCQEMVFIEPYYTLNHFHFFLEYTHI